MKGRLPGTDSWHKPRFFPLLESADGCGEAVRQADDHGMCGFCDAGSMIAVDQFRSHLVAEIDDFVALLGAADFDACVPGCPGWRVRDLVAHLGDVHRWVIQTMTTGQADTPPPEAPMGDDLALIRWYRRTADDLLQQFAVTDADTPVWTFGQPRTAVFWFRRQAHEVGVHRWDLGAAAGIDVGYDSILAEDGIDEVVTMFFPRQVRLGRIEPLTAGLGLQPEGSRQRWVLAGDGTAPTTQTDATVSGPASVLLLLLWRRIDLTDQRLRVTGAPTVATSVLGTKIVP